MIKKLYIAYGSNLNTKQMAFRCPDARPLGATVIENYELVFKGSGVASIVKCNNSKVPVGIWAISHTDEIALDIYEGFPNLYGKEYLQFVLDGVKMQGLVYIMQGNRKTNYPCLFYENTIREGYEDFGIDQKYLDDALDKCWEEISKRSK